MCFWVHVHYNLCHWSQQCTGHKWTCPVAGYRWHDQDRCDAAPTLSAAAQLRTFLECSGTTSFQLEGLLGNSTSVLRILHPCYRPIRTAVQQCVSLDEDCIATEKHGGLPAPKEMLQVTHYIGVAISSAVHAVLRHKHRHVCASSWTIGGMHRSSLPCNQPSLLVLILQHSTSIRNTRPTIEMLSKNVMATKPHCKHRHLSIEYVFSETVMAHNGSQHQPKPTKGRRQYSCVSDLYKGAL